MKPVRRKIRRHFGLAAKRVTVRAHWPWYVQWGLAVLLVAMGYLFAYSQFSEKIDNVQQIALENQGLQTKIVQVERQLQIEQVAQSNLLKELNRVQDENLRMKEDLVFYKSMGNGKKLHR